MNIIDVALLEDGAAAASPTPAGIRWLFTAKDGRVMKKSSHNSNLGALKQAFLSRVLLRRGCSCAANAARATDNGGDSRSRGDGGSSNSATGRVFATALLSSGESVPLDEAGWAALIVQESGRGKGAVAVTSLTPPGGDPATENSRRGGPTQQRYFCEYKAKPYSSSSSKSGTNVATGDLSRASTKPIQAVLTTYVLVSRGLLRDSPEAIEDESRQHHEGDMNKLNASRAATALSDERLVSRVKAINREVEAKLRRVVQWVQEVRRVHVLSIAATFIVVPSSDRGAGTSGVWLEHALHARIVSKNGEASIALGATEPAPYADPRGMIRPSTQLPPGTGRASLILTSENSQPGPTPLVPTHQNQGRGSAAREAPLTEAASSPPEETLSVADTTVPAASESRSPASPAPLQSATTPSSAGPLGAKVRQQSTAEMLSAAADAVLLSADPPSATTTTAALPLEVASQQRHLGDSGRGGVKHSIASTAAPGRYSDGRRSLLIGTESEEAVAATAASASSYARPLRERCPGDFCAYRNCNGGIRPGPSERPPPEASAPESREGGRVGVAESPAAEVNWTSIGVSDDRRNGATLLKFTDKQQQQQQLTSSPRASSEGDPRTGKEMLLSLTFKSVGLARTEAKQGLDVYWGEALRRCWREGNGRGARSLEELSPALVYREVIPKNGSPHSQKECQFHA